MASELYRWQAGMGAIAGALVAEVVAHQSGGWTNDGMRSLDVAEAMLAGAPLPIDLAPIHAVPAAVGLSTTSTPLLIDSATIALVDVIRAGLDGKLPSVSDPLVAEAAELARVHNFDAAIAAATSKAVSGEQSLVPIVGMFVGLGGGLGAIPGRLVSTLGAPDGTRGRRYLRGLTNRLLGIELPNWYDPRRRRGPKEVLPGLWLSNLYGVAQFVENHPDGLVLSLCDDEGRVNGHEHHLTFHLEDTPRAGANPSLDLVVDEILQEIETARLAGQPVLVHCRHGASRTGLLLRLLLVDELGISAEDALLEALCLWRHTSEWNKEWTRQVERRAQRA